MRPTILDPLFAPVSSLDGVGPKLASLIGKLIPLDAQGREARIGELLLYLPHTIIDRSNRPGIAYAREGNIVTLDVRIDRHEPPPRNKGRLPYRVFAHDDTGEIVLTFFHARNAWLENQLPVGAEVSVSGRVEWFHGRPSMVHPDYITKPGERMPEIEPVYALTAGLSGRALGKAIQNALTRLPVLPEWLDAEVMRRQNFPTLSDALHRLHEPRDAFDISPDSSGLRRLAYDELLASQLSLALVRARARKHTGRSLAGTGQLQSSLRSALPYRLTNAQEVAIEEISSDLSRSERMLRLLQGDVGSGKTVVALMAMVQTAESGGQSALLAPTEILARQHFDTISPLAEKIGLKVALLTGRDKNSTRKATLEGIANGSVQIAIGTHALFQEQVTFDGLALAVIDEQHRFGVHQRLALTAKGFLPDMLVMTATPIPRTLVLAAFGDMDVSRLTEKPPGRKPVKTVTLPLERLDQLIDRMRQAVESGQKIYWICPLVEESETVDLMAAEDRYKSLLPVFGDQTGLVHGRMKSEDKDAAMAAFKDGKTRILVGTTVIEVGVDVPDATIIIIEHAERFGLAQLHQLRGRVGRGVSQSSCVLLYKGPLGETASKRLEIMRETQDGFIIAEEDLKLRGEGELLGTRQSGSPGFRIARLDAHADLLPIARDDARHIVAMDSDLGSSRGQALRIMLYLYGRDEAIRLLKAG